MPAYRVLMRGGIYLIFIFAIIAQRVWSHLSKKQKQQQISNRKRLVSEVTEDNVFTAIDDKSWRMRLAAIRFLQAHPSDEAYDALLYALGDDDFDVCEAAAEALIPYEHKAVPDLLNILNTGSRMAREMAVKVLLSIGGIEAINGIRDVLQHDESAWVRIAVVETLGNTKNPEHIPVIAQALHDDHPAVVETAVDTLKQIGTAEAVQALADMPPKHPSTKNHTSKSSASLD